MIKNLLFDMGGVVFRQNTEEAFRRFRQAGINTDHYMGDYGQRGFFLDVETGKIDADEFCRLMAQEAGVDRISWEQAQYCWLGFLHDVPVERLRYLTTLRKDYHVCLVSNTNPFIMDYMRSTRCSADGKPISAYFDTLFCSYEMHAYKPHADFFEMALAHDGMKPQECLFIDDSQKNIEAARSLGLEVFHVAPNEDWIERLAAHLAQ